MLEAEEKEMKSFEMQLSHSLLFPLKPAYFSIRIQHMCGDTWKTGWAHEPRGIEPSIPSGAPWKHTATPNLRLYG